MMCVDGREGRDRGGDVDYAMHGGRASLLLRWCGWSWRAGEQKSKTRADTAP